MPITPFHFGPGAVLHATAPKRISFLAFCAANVLTDIEPLYFMLTQQFPVHRFFHTYVGATLMVAITALLFAMLLVLARVIPLPRLFNWQQLTMRQVTLGAALGSYSHIVLDSIMHADIRPWAPFSSANLLYQAISLNLLHLICVAASTAGLLIVWLRRQRHAASCTID